MIIASRDHRDIQVEAAGRGAAGNGCGSTVRAGADRCASEAEKEEVGIVEPTAPVSRIVLWPFSTFPTQAQPARSAVTYVATAAAHWFGLERVPLALYVPVVETISYSDARGLPVRSGLVRVKATPGVNAAALLPENTIAP